MRPLHGIITAIVTPFTGSGELNTKPVADLLAFQRAGGVDGVVVAGTTGEGPSLSMPERKLLLETVAQNRQGLAVLAGTGASALPEAVELTQHAARVGADAVMVLPPFYFKSPTTEGLERYYRTILDCADIPMLLYNIPQFSAVAIGNELIDMLIGHPNLVGIKDSAGDWPRTQELITRYRNLRVFSGSDILTARALREGGAGAISATSNALPELLTAVYREFRAGRDTASAQADVDAVQALVQKYPLIAVIKSIARLRGLEPMWVRPPLVELTPLQQGELESELRQRGLL